MCFKTPSFWYQKPGLISHLLTPVSWLYQIGHTVNQIIQSQPYTSSVPVICIGNAIAGGSGKTPTVISLVHALKDNGITKKPFILTRGYGGALKEATLVDTKTHASEDVGDEALLLARHAPTITASNRAAGARLAEKNGADLIIMDDGLQNSSLAKTLSFLVVDRQVDFGNNKTLPAGPLREPLSKILPKAQGIICIGPAFHSDKPVFEAKIIPTGDLNKNPNYVAFAGLGLPDKFKNTLLDLELNLVGWHPFADHYNYSEQDIEKLRQEAEDKNAILITTEKDFVRLPQNLSKDITTLPIEITFQNSNDLVSFIQDGLGKKQ